jgi:hypothetical protein
MLRTGYVHIPTGLKPLSHNIKHDSYSTKSLQQLLSFPPYTRKSVMSGDVMGFSRRLSLTRPQRLGRK